MVHRRPFASVVVRNAAIALALCSIVSCTMSTSPDREFNSGIPGKSGLLSVYMNGNLWYPENANASAVPEINTLDSLQSTRINLNAWSDGYAITFSFALPDTIHNGNVKSFVVSRQASAIFTTPWPGQNTTAPGDSIGTMNAQWVDDSTVKGRFELEFDNPYATYFLESGNFYARVAKRK